MTASDLHTSLQKPSHERGRPYTDVTTIESQFTEITQCFFGQTLRFRRTATL